MTSWELDAKSASEWGRLTVEAAKLMKHVDPSIELSSAVLADIDWNVNLLKSAARYIDWISIHGYWDFPSPQGELSDYDKVIEKMENLDDAVFSACFLNMCMRNCDIVKMANFSPAVNTRGCVFTHKDGIVLRSTYFVFLLYANLLGDLVLDEWETAARF